jgi:hypothetical protein
VGCVPYGGIKMSLPKTKSEAARDFCLTFSSVGGGVNVAIFLYVVLTSIPIQSLFIIQFIPTFIACLRLYWFYANSILFFAPFDSIWLFGVDILAYITAGITIGMIGFGNGVPWFFLFTSCLFFCYVRTKIVEKKASGRQKDYPSSYKKLKKRITIFSRSILFCGIVSLILGIILVIAYSDSLVILFCIMLTLCYLSMFYWRDEMWPDENDSARISGNSFE